MFGGDALPESVPTWLLDGPGGEAGACFFVQRSFSPRVASLQFKHPLEVVASIDSITGHPGPSRPAVAGNGGGCWLTRSPSSALLPFLAGRVPLLK